MRKKRTSIKKVNQATSRRDSIQKDKIINPRKLPYSHLISFSIKIYGLLTITALANKLRDLKVMGKKITNLTILQLFNGLNKHLINCRKI